MVVQDIRGRVAVVGGGVIGLSVAWVLAEAGYPVVLIDPRPARGASWVAGGMLAPVTESWPGEDDVLALGTASLAQWPDFAERLRHAGGDPGLRTAGTLALALDAADAATLEVLAEYLRGQGRDVDRLTGRQLRAMEPSIGPRVRSGLSVPGDLAVDNRSLLQALHTAATNAGVTTITAAATAIKPGKIALKPPLDNPHRSLGGRPTASLPAGGDKTGEVDHACGQLGETVDNAVDNSVECSLVVIAAGAWSRGLHPALDSAVRPVKGEILRLRSRSGALPVPSRTIRAQVESRPVYLVPREDGELVLGATQHEVGYDEDVTAGGVRTLLADAEQVMPGIAEYALVECAAGLRAGSRDNLPLIGWLEPGVLAATGHHRNGLLLAPATAAAVLSIVRDGYAPQYVQAADPARFLTRQGESR